MNDLDLINFHKVKEANLLDKKNVESFFPGIKISKGNTTGEKCIIVGVSKKEIKNNLSANDLIPENINGIKTDVLKSHRCLLLITVGLEVIPPLHLR